MSYCIKITDSPAEETIWLEHDQGKIRLTMITSQPLLAANPGWANSIKITAEQIAL
jgi:hypothetical protein